MTTERAPLLFLSHVSADREAARSLRRWLEREGYRVFMAPDDVRGSAPWQAQIVDAIANCDVVVVLISSGANASEHVQREVSLAMTHEKAILPVRLERVDLSGSLAYLLQLAQWIDAFPPPVDQHTQALADRLASLMGEVAEHEPTTGSDPDETALRPDWGRSTWRRTLSRPFVWIPAAAALILVVLAVAFLAAGTEPSPPPTSVAGSTSTAAETLVTSATSEMPPTATATPTSQEASATTVAPPAEQTVVILSGDGTIATVVPASWRSFQEADAIWSSPDWEDFLEDIDTNLNTVTGLQVAAYELRDGVRPRRVLEAFSPPANCVFDELRTVRISDLTGALRSASCEGGAVYVIAILETQAGNAVSVNGSYVDDESKARVIAAATRLCVDCGQRPEALSYPECTSSEALVCTDNLRLDIPSPAIPRPQSAQTDATPYEHETISDESESLDLSVPIVWTDRNLTSCERGDQPIGPGASAAVDREDFVEGWDSPGIFVCASRSLLSEFGDARSFLDELSTHHSRCETSTRGDYDDETFTGIYDLYEGCSDTKASLVKLVMIPGDSEEYLIYVYAQMLNDRDWLAFDEALLSLNIDLLPDDDAAASS